MKQCVAIYDGTMTDEDLDHVLATEYQDGLMSKEDKAKLDDLVDQLEDGSITVNLDYEKALNKPKINNIELSGNKSLKELGIQEAIAEEVEEDVIVFKKPVKVTDGMIEYDTILNPPKNLSDFNNDLKFQTEEDINNKLNSIDIFIIVNELPDDGDPKKIYLLKNPNPKDDKDNYIEYIFRNGWEMLGNNTNSSENISPISEDTLKYIFNKVNNK